jgi:glycerol uptake facilitator-like aquaporin
MSEILGSFILVLMYLTQTEEKYKLSQDAAITLMIISGAYCVGMALSHPFGALWTTSPLNPAIALAEMTFATFSGNIADMHWAWIFITFSWVGSLLAVLVYEFVFKKAQNIVQDEEINEEEVAAEEDGKPTEPLLELKE